MAPKSVPEALWEGLWEASGRVLGPSWLQDGPKSRKVADRTPTGPPKIESKSIKSLPKAIQKVIIFLIIFGSTFEAICCQLGSNLAPKTLPKWNQVGYKIDASWGVDLRAVFEGLLAQILLTFYLNMAWPM